MRHLLVILLIAMSLAVASCSRVASNESAASGGRVTVITGEDIASVKMRSTRFR